MMSDQRASSAELREAYALHTRKYRDTSLIVELFTREEGRVSVVMRGVRSKRSRIASQVQPFNRFLISWFGRSELKTSKATDFPFQCQELRGDSLLLGLYVNELLIRVLGKDDPAPILFDEYKLLLDGLGASQNTRSTESLLRRFELLVLQELGYGVPLEWDAGSGESIKAESWYRFMPEEGFHAVKEPVSDPYVFEGSHLLKMLTGDFSKPGVNASAKRIIRASYGVLLGDRTLLSRDLFKRLDELT